MDSGDIFALHSERWPVGRGESLDELTFDQEQKRILQVCNRGTLHPRLQGKIDRVHGLFLLFIGATSQWPAHSRGLENLQKAVREGVAIGVETERRTTRRSVARRAS